MAQSCAVFGAQPVHHWCSVAGPHSSVGPCNHGPQHLLLPDMLWAQPALHHVACAPNTLACTVMHQQAHTQCSMCKALTPIIPASRLHCSLCSKQLLPAASVMVAHPSNGLATQLHERYPGQWVLAVAAGTPPAELR